MELINKVKQAVILGAGERKVFDRPVGFLDIEDSTIIERLITLLNSNGIEDIIIVTGYKKDYYEELAKKKNLKLVYNDRYKWTGTMHSLVLAENYVEGNFLLIESDMVFEERALSYLLEDKNKNSLLVTSESGSGDEALVEIRSGEVFRISKDIHQLNKIDGEFIGISKISVEAYKNLIEDYKYNKNPYLNYEYALLNIRGEHHLGYTKIDDLVWSEIDNLNHYKNLKYTIYPKLQRKEMEVRQQYAKEVVCEALNIDDSTIEKIEKLGGLTNKNYKVRINGEDLVARVPGNGTNQLINRVNEKINASIAYNIGLDTEAIYFDENTGLKITRFIKDAETINPTTGKREDNMELIAGVLRTLHSCTDMFKKTFDPFVDTVFYEEILLGANGKIYEDYYDLKEKFMPLKGELLELGMVYTPCHLDALAENFVKSGEDKMYLIDWEYSGNYDKLWDVATISVEFELSEDEEELFFTKYFGKEPSEAERKRILIHKIIQDMCWSMWSAAKVAKGDQYLEDYSLHRYNRGKALLFKYLKGDLK